MELADSIKRLRELAERTEVMTDQSIFKSARQLNMHPEQGRNTVLTLSDGVISANATINQLVELVAEMYVVINTLNGDLDEIYEDCERVLTKAHEILTKLEE